MSAVKLVEHVLELDQAEHMRQLERAVLQIERLGELHDARLAVVVAQRLAHFLDGGCAYGNPMLVAQVRLQCGIDLVGLAGRFSAHRLGRRLKRVEMVGVVAEEVVDQGLGRGREKVVGHALAAEPHHLLQRRAMAGVEAQETLDEARGVVEGGAQLLQVGHAFPEEWIAQGIAQVGEAVGGIVGDEVAPVDTVDVRQRHQHLDGQAALVVLQQVDVGGRDTQRAGHLSLGLLVLAPELAQARSDQGLVHGASAGIVAKFYKFTYYRYSFSHKQHIYPFCADRAANVVMFTMTVRRAGQHPAPRTQAERSSCSRSSPQPRASA